MVENLTFQVEEIVFANDGYHIARTDKGSVKGNFAAKPGYCYLAQGTWDKTSPGARRYGASFVLTSAEQVDMISASALVKYLELQFKGEGLGKRFFEVILEGAVSRGLCLETLLNSQELDILVECAGKRNAKKVAQLLKEWPKIKPQSDYMTPLLNYGLSEAQCLELIAVHNKNAINVVESSPYDLINTLDGVSFLRADLIAKRVGFVDDADPIRLRAAFSTAMRDSTAGGDLGVLRHLLINRVRVLVNDTVMVDGRRRLDESVPLRVSDKVLEDTLDRMLSGEFLDERGNPCEFSSRLIELEDEKGKVAIWFEPLLRAEDRIVNSFKEFDASPRPDLIDQLSDLVSESGLTLDPAQLEAVEMVLTHPISVITGGPGCGKSFILKLILEVFDLAKLTGDLAAPTGKAAKRITESTGRKAQTIHSLIGMEVGGKCRFNKTEPLPSDFLIIDEASMVDTYLLASVLSAVKTNTRVIIVGDVDQLPSVGPGQVLRDIIRSRVVPITRLTKGWRFSGGIASAAMEINNGILPDSTEDGQFEFVDTTDPASGVLERIKMLQQEGVDLEDIQVLSPTNRGGAGCEALNRQIQLQVNPEASRKPATKQRLNRPSGDILVGDKAMQIRNDHKLQIVNGDIGWIDNISSYGGTVQYSLPDKEESIKMTEQEAKNLRLAYAITVHKSQGAESPYILIAIDSSAAFMMRRCLIYTAVTRGIKKVVVFASSQTLARAVRIGEPAEGSRRTLLNSKLQEAFNLEGEFDESKALEFAGFDEGDI